VVVMRHTVAPATSHVPMRVVAVRSCPEGGPTGACLGGAGTIREWTAVVLVGVGVGVLLVLRRWLVLVRGVLCAAVLVDDDGTFGLGGKGVFGGGGGVLAVLLIKFG